MNKLYYFGECISGEYTHLCFGVETEWWWVATRPFFFVDEGNNLFDKFMIFLLLSTKGNFYGATHHHLDFICS